MEGSVQTVDCRRAQILLEMSWVVSDRLASCRAVSGEGLVMARGLHAVFYSARELQIAPSQQQTSALPQVRELWDHLCSQEQLSHWYYTGFSGVLFYFPM